MTSSNLDDRGMPSGMPLHPEYECTPREAQSRAGTDAVLLDCRTQGEVLTASIEGATHIPLDELASRIEDVRDLAEDRDIIVFCHHGVRSMRATAFLREQGIEGVRSMAGGIDLW